METRARSLVKSIVWTLLGLIVMALMPYNAWGLVGLTLAMVPIAMTAGFVALGLYPTLAVLVVVQVAYRAGRYGLTKPAREMLWTVLGREEKYKAKNFIDTTVYRTGDQLGAWSNKGLLALGLTFTSMAFLTVPLARSTCV